MKHIFDSGGFFTFLIALAHGSPLLASRLNVLPKVNYEKQGCMALEMSRPAKRLMESYTLHVI